MQRDAERVLENESTTMLDCKGAVPTIVNLMSARIPSLHCMRHCKTPQDDPHSMSSIKVMQSLVQPDTGKQGSKEAFVVQ